MSIITKLSAIEILDSRGRPTVQATCELESGAVGTASVPSGASTGTAEALELRDGDPSRYRGLGCRKAVGNVNGELNNALSGKSFDTQDQLDKAMLKLDGTKNKARLGANAILAVSLAFARAQANERGVPLYQHFADMVGLPLQSLPRPEINLFSGGKHAGGQVAIQDVLVVPIAAQSIDEALATTYAVYQAAVDHIARLYEMRALTADEGGLAPVFPSSYIMLQDAVMSIAAANLQPGVDVALAVDVAATHFYDKGSYVLDGEWLPVKGMIAELIDWLDKYPIISIEDGLVEDDWINWPELRFAVNGRALIVGDDFLCTNPRRIEQAIHIEAADTLLLKVNQIGTLTEAAESLQLARDANWRVIVSARSGETEDNWLADLAVGWAADYIKVGSITQSERLAKYNRLLVIEAETGLPIRS